MNILSHFNEFLINKVKENINIYMRNICNCLNNNPFNFDCYTTFVEELDTFSSKLTTQAYQEFILLLDEEFMQSKNRKLSYDSKGFLTKPLLTKFGWIIFKRRRYISKENGETLMYVDRLLGLAKHSRLDPFVIADLCEAAASTSYSNAGVIVSKTIGTKVKYDNDINKNILSRATVRNNVLKAVAIMNEPAPNEAKIISELNIMIDEKFVPSQFNDGKDHMVKSAIVFEKYKREYGNRMRLVGKKVFASVEDNLLKDVTDYIYYHYDTDKLKKINIMGDGALWIKSFALDSSFKYHKDLIIKFGLDHFHMAQALKQIATNKNEIHYKFMYRYVRQNKFEYFLKVCNSLMKLHPHREHTIREKMLYIVNNWESIQTSFREIEYKCSMESNISHILADLFTARPKAYSKEGLIKLLKLRLLKTNGYDMKKLYFEALKKVQKEIKDKEIIERNIISNIKFNDSLYNCVPEMHSSSELSLSLRNIINSGIKI